jgi:hypothetical protein
MTVLFRIKSGLFFIFDTYFSISFEDWNYTQTKSERGKKKKRKKNDTPLRVLEPPSADPFRKYVF